MKHPALIGLCLLMACGEGQAPPPAHVGSAAPPKKDDPLLHENRAIAEREALDIDGWIQRHGLTMHRTGTGVRILLVRDVPGPTAAPGSMVRVNFAISLINGQQCYASAPGSPEEFQVEHADVESGLQEAVQYMSPGDSAIIVIPSHRAFGLVGDQNKIPMRSTVIYDLGLVSVR